MGLGLEPEFLGEGGSISDLSCWGIFVLLNISLSRVKEIVGKVGWSSKMGIGVED